MDDRGSGHRGACRGRRAVQRAGAVAGVVGVAAQRGLHEHGAPAGGGGAVVHGGDVRVRAEPAGERGGGIGGPRWIGGADEERLAGARLQARGIEPLVGVAGLADARLRAGELLGAGHPAGDEAADDDRQPEGDHRLRTARREQRDRLHDAAQPVAHRRFRGTWRQHGGGHLSTVPVRAARVAAARHRACGGVREKRASG